jgi:hypothetical protein
MVAKLKGSKIAQAAPLIHQGKYRWSFQYKNGKVMDKYNADGSKNVYCSREEDKGKVHVPLQDVTAAALTDSEGNVVAVMDVPEGAVVFQRRRVRDINYYNRYHDIVTVVPECVIDGRYYPERKVTKRYPEYTYSEMWLIGWRKREVDGSMSVCYKAVYPDGKVEEYTDWNVKPWLKEPEFFDDETVDADDKARRDLLRQAKAEHTKQEFYVAHGTK